MLANYLTQYGFIMKNLSSPSKPKQHNKKIIYNRPYTRSKPINFWQLLMLLGIIMLLLLHAILLPFAFGVLIAYLLNPIIGALARLGISRLWGTVLISIFVILVLVLILTVFLPIISWQLHQFVTKAIPIYFEDLQTLFESKSFIMLRNYFITTSDQPIGANIQNLIAANGDLTKSFMSSILSSGKSIVGSVSLFIIAPVVAFYILLDWEYMITAIDALIPRQHLSTVHTIIKDIDRSIAGFVRGQGTVCLILGVYYALTLSVWGLNYGILLGLYVGIASFIPYIGSASGFLIALLVAWTQYYDFDTKWYYISAVIGIFLFGHFIESYVLQPKLVGNSVGLHPVWLIFALIAFGYLFGFVGMLVAVPTAAAIGVLVRFAINNYVASSMYKGK